MAMKEWTDESGGMVEYFLDHTPSDGGATMSLGVHKRTGELYVNGKKVATELKFKWWVDAAVILGALSTVVMAFVAVMGYLNSLPIK